MPGCVQPIARQEIVRGNGVCAKELTPVKC